MLILMLNVIVSNNIVLINHWAYLYCNSNFTAGNLKYVIASLLKIAAESSLN